MNAQVEPRAYGAGVAGSSFNIVTFIKKPKVICEILALVIIDLTNRFDRYFIYLSVEIGSFRRFSRLSFSVVSPKKAIGKIDVAITGRMHVAMESQLVSLLFFLVWRSFLLIYF